MSTKPELSVVGGAKPKRVGISKKIRFEVFKRDNFTCQYCGKAAPDVILNVDHIHPVSKGGDPDILNLITSCFDCNNGKGATALSDDSAIQKQRAQLKELNERREQLEMMLQWREGLKSIETDYIDAFVDAFNAISPGYSLNDYGITDARKLIRKFGLNECLEAIETAGIQYIKLDDGGRATPDSVQTAFRKIGGILRLRGMPDAERELYYVRGILRNRCTYIKEYEAMRLLREAVACGINVDWLKENAKTCSSWSGFAFVVGGAIQDMQEDTNG